MKNQNKNPLVVFKSQLVSLRRILKKKKQPLLKSLNFYKDISINQPIFYHQPDGLMECLYIT